MDMVALFAQLATSVAAIVALIELARNIRISNKNAKRDAINQAVEIAKIYQSSIIDKMTFLLTIYQSIEFDKYMRKLLPDISYKFNTEEAHKVMGDACFKEQENYIQKIDMTAVNVARQKFEECINGLEEGQNDKLKQVLNQASARITVIDVRGDLLNTLEWIAMLINTGVADESVIYPSLHQTFLPYIRMEYLTISNLNSENNDADKYYTNIIELYEKWTKKREASKNREREAEEKLSAQRARTKRNIVQHATKL